MPTQVAIAQHLDLSSRSVRELQASGVLPAGASMDECRVAYIRHLRTRAAGRVERPPAATEEELAAEKLRLTKAQADKTEHEAEKERLAVEVLLKNLIPADEVEREWTDILAAVRAKMLTIPSKAASRVMAAKSRAEAEAILKSLIWEALAELSKDEGGDGPGEEGEGEVPRDPEPTAGPDSKPVGRSRAKAKSGGQRRTRKVQ